MGGGVDSLIPMRCSKLRTERDSGFCKLINRFQKKEKGFSFSSDGKKRRFILMNKRVFK